MSRGLPKGVELRPCAGIKGRAHPVWEVRENGRPVGKTWCVRPGHWVAKCWRAQRRVGFANMTAAARWVCLGDEA